MTSRTAYQQSSEHTTTISGNPSTTTVTSEDAIRSDFFYDSLISHFSLSVCVQEFALQMTFPLLLPIFYWKYGSFFLASHEFLLHNFSGFQNYTLQGIFVYLLIYNLNKVDDENDVIYRAMLMPIFFMTIHRIMISIKYACLSPTEYRRVMRGKTLQNQYHYPNKEERQLGNQYQNKLQLVTNFHSYSSASLWLEIYVASKTIPVDMNAIFITITTNNSCLRGSNVSELLRWERLLRSFYPHEPMQNMIVPISEGNYRISAKVVMGALYGHLRSPIPVIRTVFAALSLGVIFGSIPLLNLENSFTSYDLTTKIQLVLALLFSVTYFTFVTMFGGVAIADQIRRTQFALYLGEMIHFADSTLKLDFRITNAKETSRNDMKVLPDLLSFSSTSTGISNNNNNSGMTKRHSSLNIAKDEKSMASTILLDSISGDTNSSDHANSILSSSSSISSNVETDETIPLNEIRMPSLDFSSTMNLSAWFSMRRVVQSLNQRLRFRIDMYVMILITAFILMIFYLLGLSISDRDITSVMTRTENLQGLFALMLFTFILCVYICIGALSNLRMERHW